MRSLMYAFAAVAVAGLMVVGCEPDPGVPEDPAPMDDPMDVPEAPMDEPMDEPMEMPEPPQEMEMPEPPDMDMDDMEQPEMPEL